ALRRGLREGDAMFEWRADAKDNPYFGLLAHADGFVVTGDSMSMITEVARLNRPLAIYPLRRSAFESTFRRALPRWLTELPNTLKYRVLPRIGFTAFPRDLTQIHRELIDAGLAVEAGQPWQRTGRTTTDEVDRVVDAIVRVANAAS